MLIDLVSLGRGFEIEEMLMGMNSLLGWFLLVSELRNGIDLFFAIEFEVGGFSI